VGDVPGSDPRVFADLYQDEKIAAAKRDPSGKSGSVHTVKGGETLAKIAIDNGIKLKDLIQGNPIFTVEDPNRISVGMELWIPPRAR
jgi:LysM repeat protein